MAFSLSGWLTGSKAAPRPKQAGKPSPARRSAAVSPYHAVAVKPGPGCCGPVLEVRRQRFLPRQAPALPLAGCTAARCACVYAHYEDRRSGSDRRMRVGAIANDRRLGSGRRDSDH